MLVLGLFGRRLFNRAYDTFCPTLPALFAMTVIGAKEDGELVTRGLFVGDTSDCFQQAAKLSLEVGLFGGLFGSIWFYLGLFGSIWVHLGLFGFIWVHFYR